MSQVLFLSRGIWEWQGKVKVLGKQKVAFFDCVKMLIECAPLTICISLIPSPNEAILFTNLIWMPFIYLSFLPSMKHD
jgi:hypothetical protein